MWKNERKICTRDKQMELKEWTKKSDYDVCAINETGSEYVEVGDEKNGLGQIEVLKKLHVKDMVRKGRRWFEDYEWWRYECRCEPT